MIYSRVTDGDVNAEKAFLIIGEFRGRGCVFTKMLLYDYSAFDVDRPSKCDG